jgi:hypothetical protein
MATDLENSIFKNIEIPINISPKRKKAVSVAQILFPITINQETYYWTSSASRSYERAYDLPKFDELCKGHVMKNIQEAREINGKFFCPEIILSKKGVKIMSVKINIDGTPIAPDIY